MDRSGTLGIARMWAAWLFGLLRSAGETWGLRGLGGDICLIGGGPKARVMCGFIGGRPLVGLYVRGSRGGGGIVGP